MAKTVTTKNGKTFTLLNPAEKARKFANELSTGIRKTNAGDYKPDKNGDVGLSAQGRAYRAGYLDARKDSAKAWKHKQKKGR